MDGAGVPKRRTREAWSSAPAAPVLGEGARRGRVGERGREERRGRENGGSHSSVVIELVCRIDLSRKCI